MDNIFPEKSESALAINPVPQGRFRRRLSTPIKTQSLLQLTQIPQGRFRPRTLNHRQSEDQLLLQLTQSLKVGFARAKLWNSNQRKLAINPVPQGRFRLNERKQKLKAYVLAINPVPQGRFRLAPTRHLRIYKRNLQLTQSLKVGFARRGYP